MSVDGSQALSTLASNTIVIAALGGGTMGREVYWIGGELQLALRDLTPGEGPLEVGICHSDYSTTQVLEKLEADPFALNEVVLEQARRRVRRIGTFSGLAESEVLNNGTTISFKARFMMREGTQPSIWIRNKSGAVLTAGAFLVWTGSLWMRKA